MSDERRHSWNAGLRERFRRLEDRWNRAHPAIVIANPAVNLAQDDSDEWRRWGIPAQERHALETKRPNVLIIGPRADTTHVLSLVARTCRSPLMSCGSSPLTLPSGEVRTLLVPNAEGLGAVEQQLLHEWISCAIPIPQIITTATAPLFPLMVRGAFNDALFYRLNEVCLMVHAGVHTPARRTRTADAPERAGRMPGLFDRRGSWS